ncbi:hypothetical protein TELCIR_14128 [Teladorsagia circumcincta]|uniref:NR LBD domain-containing protein n=1 Tax=Teladorsagia circumcincta TaxID=45464 RepID=A0A2G9U3I4_TELCI|nr:hypothetical protein TELCIR_14128 [Teladorsagia circumcincta]
MPTIIAFPGSEDNSQILGGYIAISERSTLDQMEDIPNVTKETIDVAEQVKSRLAEDVHSYYTYELRKPNYASRLHKMSSIVSAVDKLQERRKEDSQLSRMFNIFKQDVFMSELF